MSYSYETKKPKQTKAPAHALTPHGPSMDALRSGAVKPSQEQIGQRVDLPDAIRSKMEDAFGTDLSAVRLYKSRAVEEAGANAVTQGADIAFAPDMLDFSSYGGRALLGHEISHVVSQSRGEVRGSGFLNDPALEARADREGALAASVRQVAVPASPVSSAAPSAGPMQAAKKRGKGQEEPEGIELQDFAEAPKPEEKVPKSNGAFESLVGALVDQKDTVSSFTDPFSDLDETKKDIAAKTKSMRKIENFAGRMLSVEALKDGTASRYIGSKAETGVDLLKASGIEKVAQKTAGISGWISASAAMPQAVMKLGGAYEKLDKAKKYGTRQDVEDAKLDLASSGLGTMSKGNSLASAITKQFSTAAAETAGTVTKHIGGALGLGAQGIGLFKSARHLKESTARKRSMAASVAAMKQRMRSGEMSEDEKEKLAIFRQGKRNAAVDQKQSAFDTVSGSLGLTGTVLGMAGVAPASAVFSGAQSAVSTVGDEVMSYERDKIQKKTVEEKYHAKEKYYSALLHDEKFRKMGVSKRAFKKKYLKALGAGHGSKEEAYQILSGSRADKLLEGLRNNEDWAIEFAGNAGIGYENLGKSEEHDKGIRASLLKALNGGKEEEEFHSSDAREYNAFEKAAEEERKWEEDKRPLKEKVKDLLAEKKEAAGDYMRNAWESVKTGGKKALTAAKRTGKGAWGLMKRGFQGAKKLATSSEARSEAWKSIKTGAATAASKAGTGIVNAGKAIGRGAVSAYEGTKRFLTDADARSVALENVKTGASKAANYVTNVVRHSAKSRMRGLRDWYNEGVDQMNAHGDTYKQMSALDRFLWSAKNLPARMTHGWKRNQAATKRRMKENEDAEAAVAYLMQKEEEEKRQSGE